MKVTISELNSRIDILHRVEGIDESGSIYEAGTELYASVWAMVLPYSSKIQNADVEAVKEILYKVVIRYRKDVRDTDVILWDGMRLSPVAPPYQLGGKRKFLGIECRELVEDE